MFYVPQIQNDDCGFACLKMLLAKVHNDRNYLYLPQDEEHGLYSYQDLKLIASRYGVTLNGYKEADRSAITNIQIFPVIVTINNEEGGAHAIMIYRADSRRIYYLDPKEGRASMPIKKFLLIWDGSMLIAEKVDKQLCPYKEQKILKPSEHFAYALMQVCTGLCALLGVYFIGVDVYVFIPIILFSLAAVFEMITKAYSLSLMKKIDAFFYENIHIKKGNYKQTLIRFEKYKKSLLASPLSFLLALIVCFSLMLIILQNDMRNIVLIVTSFITSVTEVLLYRPLLKKEVRRLTYMENDLDSSKDDDVYKSKVSRIHQKTYRVGLVEISKNCIGLTLFMAIAIVLMAGKQIVSFPYVVFYFALQLALYHSFDKVLLYPDELINFKKAKVEINNCLHH